MADQDLKSIFEQAAGKDPVAKIKDDGSDMKAIFQQAHDQPDASTMQAAANQDQSNPQWTKLQSLGQGALQGVTAGFSDELGGAAGALQEKLLGNPGKKSLKELYQEYRDMHRKKNKEAEEANPGSYLTGNVVGGIGGAVLAPEALALNTIPGAIGIGAATGLGTSDTDLTNPTKNNIKQASKDILSGGALGAVGSGIQSLAGKALNPIARKMGQAGKSLFGKAAKEGLNSDTEALANNIVNSIKKEKSKVGDAYDAIMDANKDKKIDLGDFAQSLQKRADALDTSLPEQARDKKAIMDLIQKVTEGPEVEKTINIPGSITTKQVHSGYQSTGTIPQGPSSQDILESEGKQLIEGQRQLGKNASQIISPSEDNDLISRIIKTNDDDGITASVKTIPNDPGTAAYTNVQPTMTDVQSQKFIPQIQTIREGGSLTPDASTAKILRSNLGNIANEKNLSSSGERFANQTYSDLTDTLKNQIPELAPTDAKYSALLSTARKFGIKGNDEDVIKVLRNITSNNQGKQILVDQALGQLQKVNPDLVNTIQSTAKSIDQKADMIDKVNNLGDYQIFNPKQLMNGLVKDTAGVRIAAGNAVGLLENKMVKTPIGNIVQKSIKTTPTSLLTNPFSQEKVQGKITGAAEATQNTSNLYNATDDSLKQVANKFNQTPGLEFYAEHLNKAIDTNDQGEKNRAIFLIMQNPKARSLVTPE